MSTPDATTTPCPQCGSPVPAGAKFCGACGAQQPEAAAPVSAPAPDPAPVTTSTSPEPFADVPVAAWPGSEPQPAAQPQPAQAPAAPTPQAPPGRVAPPPVAGSVPSAGDFAGQLATQLRTPGPSSAGLTAAISVVAALALALLVVALPLGQASVLGATDDAVSDGFERSGVGFVSRVLLMAGQTVGAPLQIDDDYASQSLPLLVTLLLVGAIAFAARSQGRRVRDLRPAARLAWGAASGVPFAAVMGLLAVIAKSEVSGDGGSFPVETAVGGVMALALLWGAVGGLIGAWWALSADERANLLPRYVAARGAVFVILRTLVVALGLLTAVVTGVVVVQTVREAGDVTGLESSEAFEGFPGFEGRGVGQAAVENGLYALEHGIHAFDLGAFAKFRRPRDGGLVFQFKTPGEGGSLNLPVPVTKASKVYKKKTYGLTSYSDVLPSWVFAAGLIFLVGGVAVLAVYAGFAAARIGAARGSATHGGVWGVLTGPLWAVVMVALSVLATKTSDYPLFGVAEPGNVFWMVLLFGAVGGAIGGTLGHDAARRATPVPVAPAPPSPFGPPAQ